MSEKSKAIVFDWRSIPTAYPSGVVELELESGATAQVASTPEGSGFLIRVWQPGELLEQGGGNLTCASLTIEFPLGLAEIVKVETHKGARR